MARRKKQRRPKIDYSVLSLAIESSILPAPASPNTPLPDGFTPHFRKKYYWWWDKNNREEKKRIFLEHQCLN